VITAVPTLKPVTIPELEPTAATPGEPDVHVPPDGVPVRLVVEPTQVTAGPVITGCAFTVTVVVVKQPVDNIKVMTTTPGATPVTTPVAEPTVAIVVLLLVHTPTEGVAFSTTVPPTHTDGPGVVAMITGLALTVIVVVTIQPAGRV